MEENKKAEGLLYENAAPPKKKPSKWRVPVLVLCVVIIGAGYVYMKKDRIIEIDKYDAVREKQEKLDELYAREKPPVTLGDTDPYNYGLEEEYDQTQELSGVLVFTGRNRDIREQMSVYFWDVATQEDYIPEFLLKNNIFLFGEFNNIQNPTGLFLDTISSASSYSRQSQLGVHYYDLISDKFEYISSADGLSEARSLEWSLEGKKLAFTRMKKPMDTILDMGELSNWEVVIIDPEEDVHIATLDFATQPKWSPDGSKLVYLKSDGVYTYNLLTSAEKRIHAIEEGGKVLSTSMIDVSPDGQYLAWTIAHHGMIVMNRIINWDEVELEEIGRISIPNTHVLWPQFSPDSKFYAVQAIDAPKPGESRRENSRFEIRPTLGREVVKSHQTNAFTFTEFHTDGWIAYDPANKQ